MSRSSTLKRPSVNLPPHTDSRGSPSSVLVTGATSYLGLRVVERLLADGHPVTTVVRPSSQVERLDGLSDGLTLRVHDGSTESMIEVVGAARPEAVVHLATRYVREHSPGDVEPLITSNVLFGAQLLDAMRHAGCRRLVWAGTYFQHFDTDGHRPLNLYAATKQAFSDFVAYYADAHAFEAVSLVLYEVYGPGDWRPKLIDAIHRAQRDGTPMPLPTADLAVDLVHVDDVVDAFTSALELLDIAPETVAGGEFSVSSGNPIPLSAVLDVFEELGENSIERAWGEYESPGRSIATPWEGPPLPGWAPRVTLREGLERYLRQQAGR